MKILLLPIALLLLFAASVFAQQENTVNARDESKTFTMAAGNRFKASGWKQLWWGKHWRDEWLVPVSFPIFDMDTTAGGLIPLKRGGGHETKTLRLQGANGKEYVLRTIDKSLDVLIPEEFKGSFVADLVNDQVSTAHPYGPLVTASLSESIGIMHTNPVLVYLPDHPRLDTFRNDFADKLCLFEERPSGDGWDNTSLTRFANNIVNSEKLFTKLQGNNLAIVDQKEFLKIRLFDMLINDWDRHEDQWVWTALKKGNKTIYQPFARDRDQSFSKTDGINLYLLSRPWALRAIQNMNARVTDVIGTNISAVIIDRKFLNALTAADWKQGIGEIQQLLTDSAIEHALQQMPKPVYELSRNFLYTRLRQRRDDMLSFGMRYYKILNREITITGSDQAELFTINNANSGKTEITIQAFDKYQQPADTIYHRVFTPSVTKEINLYGLDGNDQFVYTGSAKSNIRVRALGGEGQDIYRNNSFDSGRLKKSIIYDLADDRAGISKTLRYKATADTSVTNYHKNVFKYDWWLPLVIPLYNPDDGVLVGAGFTYKKQQWNKQPFGWQQTIGGDYAASTGAYSLFYKGVFNQVLGKWALELAANYKAPAFVLNYYGTGNETELVKKEKTFYRVRARSIFFNPAVSRQWNKNYFKAGLVFNTVKVESASNKFIGHPNSDIDSAVFKTRYFAGVNMSYDYSSANSKKYPTSGIHINAGSEYLINLKESKRNFVRLQSGFTFYYSPFERITLAHRTGASTNIGDYEFYQANTIGGSENLRGYWRTRFTGQSSFYQNTDIRIKLTDLKGYVLRGSLGVYGFFDDGRVWVKSEHSNTIHTGYGGGIYFIPYSTLAINISYAASTEVSVFTFRTGFLF